MVFTSLPPLARGSSHQVGKSPTLPPFPSLRPRPPSAVTASWHVVTWCWSARRFQTPGIAGLSLSLFVVVILVHVQHQIQLCQDWKENEREIMVPHSESVTPANRWPTYWLSLRSWQQSNHLILREDDSSHIIEQLKCGRWVQGHNQWCVLFSQSNIVLFGNGLLKTKALSFLFFFTIVDVRN